MDQEKNFLILCNEDDIIYPLPKGNTYSSDILPSWYETRCNKISDLDKYQDIQFKFVIIDHSFLDQEYNRNYIEIIEQVKKTYSKLPFFMVSSEPVSTIYNAVNHGVIAFLNKNTNPRTWENTIINVLEKFLSNKNHKELFQTSINSYNYLLADIKLLIEKANLPVFLWGREGVGKYFIIKEIINKKYNLIKLEASEIMFSNDWINKLKGDKKDTIIFIKDVEKISTKFQLEILDLFKNNWKTIISSRHNIDELEKNNPLEKSFLQYIGSHPIRIWSLLERAQDIPMLIEHFLLNPEVSLVQSPFFGVKWINFISKEVLEKLQGYDWKVNITELKNTVYTLVRNQYIKNTSSIIELNDLPRKFDVPSTLAIDKRNGLIAAHDFLKDLDYYLINHSWNRTIVANILKINPQEVVERVRGIYKNHPEIFLKDQYKSTFQSYRPGLKYKQIVNIFLWYHPRSKIFADQLIKIAQPEIRLHPILLEDRDSAVPLGRDTRSMIETKIKYSDVFICFLCQDGINEIHGMPIFLERLTSLNKINILIKARAANLGDFFNNQKYQMIPRDENTFLTSFKHEDELQQKLVEYFNQDIMKLIHQYFTEI